MENPCGLDCDDIGVLHVYVAGLYFGAIYAFRATTGNVLGSENYLLISFLIKFYVQN